MAPPVCAVAIGDVVRVWFPGDNGVDKRRFCVITDRKPGHDPDLVLLIGGCSETKYGSDPYRYERIEADTDAFRAMKLENATTFHIEDTRAFDARSPQLKKVGLCPRQTFLAFKRLVEQWLYEGNEVVLLPDNARPAARAAHAKLVESLGSTE